MPSFVRYIGKRYTADLYRYATGPATRMELLWGDRVEVVDTSGPRWRIRARGAEGYIPKSHLRKTGLLELYFIDVGQGDGVLIRLPDDRHILIDGGWPRRNQPTGKNASDFVDWKFHKDYGRTRIALDDVICSHNDQDHYGGLWDLLNASEEDELDASSVSVERFWHAGLSWWRGNPGRTLGPWVDTPKGRMWTRLLGDRASLEAGLGNGGPEFQGEWKSFLQTVQKATRADGSPTLVGRLSDSAGFLPGYEGPYGVTIKVLAPVDFEVAGAPAIRRFSGGNSINTNGNSVLLRIDYRGARFLLTGDLNTESQRSLLEDYAGREDEFACDVMKGCHHGSGHVSRDFLQAAAPSCTILSSGDSEGHDHPKPAVIGASGLTGFATLEGDEPRTPMVYSTELARSVDLGRVTRLARMNPDGTIAEEFTGAELGQFRVTYETTRAGERTPRTYQTTLNLRRIAARTTYGLVNVRTDGHTIICACLNEARHSWNVQTFESRFG